ncbi:MAG TPA: 16S rRNA (cytosine(1402)-N(4))-methyltransferase RsmH [Bacillota bacterium]|nr:16S rRNA (cytosine(1402)-N(4))-methyltransferase RsmH [Bacillota bacterium]
MTAYHIPVLVDEVLSYLIGRNPGVYVDATLGDGGHAAAICSRLAKGGRLIGLDWDAGAVERARSRLAEYEGMATLVQESYTRLEEILPELGFPRVDGVLLDLGVSTWQLMDPARGFSFHRDEPLDMRMDRRLSLRAADLVNTLPEEELAALIFKYGEERWAGRIAAFIARHREKKGLIESSGQLAEIIKEAIPAAHRRKGGHPARRTFQALRLAVNRELENIEAVLPQALRSLNPGGRLVVIAYHSLEDRIVKRFFQEQSGGCTCPPGLPCICSGEGRLKLLTRKAVRPSAQELERNPRSRSARLRAAQCREAF